MAVAEAALHPNFPSDLVAFRVPSIGLDYRTAWENAAQKCGSERIALVATRSGEHMYVVAARAEDVPPGSWCPFAAVLPTSPLSEPVAYGHGTEARLCVLLIAEDGEPKCLAGPPSTVSKAVERSNAKLQRLDLEALHPVPWIVQSLDEEAFIHRAGSRIVTGCLYAAAISLLIMLLSVGVTLIARGRAHSAMEAASERTLDLMRQARGLAVNDVAAQIGHLDDLDRGILQLGGQLLTFKMTQGNAPVWGATFPPSVTADAIADLKGRSDSITQDGAVYATSR